MTAGLGGLVPLYQFIEEKLPQSNGRPRKLRTMQDLVKRYGIPVHSFGTLRLVDPAEAEAALRKANQHVDRTPRKPGRPKGGRAA